MGKGTGMGLAAAYGVIRDLNGTITVESVQGEDSFFWGNTIQDEKRYA
jgi:signal transduction histidine kinase